MKEDKNAPYRRLLKETNKLRQENKALRLETKVNRTPEMGVPFFMTLNMAGRFQSGFACGNRAERQKSAPGLLIETKPGRAQRLMSGYMYYVNYSPRREC